MDKSKIGAIIALIALGGILLVSKMHDQPAPPTDEPQSDAEPTTQATSGPAPSATALSGGVTTLKIVDERPGTGTIAANGDNLTMNYRGTLLSGQEFDASYGKAPFTFQLGTGGVIKGWDQGILGMKEGGKRKLTIPASLGYGDRGAGEKIPGGATLVFEVELIKVEKPKKG